MNDDAGLGRIGPGTADMPALAGGIARDGGGGVGGDKREGARAKNGCDRQFDGSLHLCLSDFSRILEREGNVLCSGQVPRPGFAPRTSK